MDLYIEQRDTNGVITYAASSELLSDGSYLSEIRVSRNFPDKKWEDMNSGVEKPGKDGRFESILKPLWDKADKKWQKGVSGGGNPGVPGLV